MKLNLTVNGVDQQIEILSPAPACRFRLGEGAERTADVALPAPGVYSILLDGRSYDAQVERTARHLIVTLEGHHFEIEVRDPRRWSRQAAGRAGSDIETIAAPMPGKADPHPWHKDIYSLRMQHFKSVWGMASQQRQKPPWAGCLTSRV